MAEHMERESTLLKVRDQVSCRNTGVRDSITLQCSQALPIELWSQLGAGHIVRNIPVGGEEYSEIWKILNLDCRERGKDMKIISFSVS